MRQILGLLVILTFILACKQKEKSVANTEANNEEKSVWVSYEAANNSNGKSIVLVSGDEEYRSEEAMPQLAKILSQHHGFDCKVLFAQDPENLGVINPNYRHFIPGLHLLNKADLVIWFTRFRELPPMQMEEIENYLKSGKPLIGIRTATHAFNIEDKNHPFIYYSWNYDGENEEWYLGFGKRVLGESWYTHHGDHKHQSTRGVFSAEEATHPILNGIDTGDIWGATDVYGIRTPISKNAKVLVYGKSIDREGNYDESDLFYGMRQTDNLVATLSGPKDKPYNPNTNMPPIAWLNQYQLRGGIQGQSFTSTIGAASDLLDEEVRRLLVNSSFFLLDMEVPELANVSLVGEYNPNQFGFHDDAHWKNLNLRVNDFIKK
ncbi:ThuA domain-containing protein [Croceivirga thetidis]|uniref:ThuA domain-containing protein n=1 Tax=Croceivirga thetidis TaxID=2721623 RepID=A0ABX1GPX9_9FLAO|nr:ThuA domain-containing protein [Croceivirga thetidis]NKI31973.1 ThuA domain-containing protein [Croceivirga thetidis]